MRSGEDKEEGDRRVGEEKGERREDTLTAKSSDMSVEIGKY